MIYHQEAQLRASSGHDVVAVDRREGGRTFVTFRDGKVRLAEGPLPKLAPREVLVTTLCSIISSGTELAQLRNEFTWWRRPDRCPGYSAVVRCQAVGEEVHDLHPGEVLFAQTPHATVALMEPAKHVWAPVPTGLDFEAAALTGLLAVGLFGVRKSQVSLGTSVLVIGDGPIGLACALFCRKAGARPVILAGRHPRRLVAGRACEATTVMNKPEIPLVQALRDSNCLQEVETVICATPAADAFRDACAVCAPQGRVVLLGTYAQPLSYHPWHDNVQSHGLSLDFVHQPLNDRAAQIRDRRLILELLAAGEVPADALITHRLPYTRAAEAYDLVANQRDETICVVLDWTREQ